MVYIHENTKIKMPKKNVKTEKEKSELSIKQKEIKNRQEKVKDLYFIKKHTIIQVAEKLGVEEKTVRRDIKKIKKEFYKQIKELDAKSVLLKVMKTREKVLQKLWEEYERTIDKCDGKFNYRFKIAALKEIDNIEKQNINDLQELGFLDKIADTHTLTGPIEITWVDPKKKKEEEEKPSGA